MNTRVLVVDDEKDIRDLLLEDLQDAGYITRELENGSRIVDVATEFRPDVIILDLTMPVVDGFQALTKLKTDSNTAGIPVVIASAQIGKVVQLAVRDLGATDFMMKPWEEGELVWRVEQANGAATDLVA